MPTVLEQPFDLVSIRRNVCRAYFEDFVKEFWEQVPGAGKVIWNWHITYLCGVLQDMAERVFRGEPKEYDGVFNVSPGTSKSTVCSILFPCWVWTRMPQARILTASHTHELVLDLATKSRDVMRSDLFCSHFPEIEFSEAQDTKGYYRNSMGGDRLTCTVGGKSPMGFHGHFLITDDPLDPKKAVSELEIKNAKDFITNILPTRKVDKAVSVSFLIMQRLDRDDPSAVLLENAKKDGGTKIFHVCLPAELLKGDDGAYLATNVNPPELVRYYVDGLMDTKRLPRSILRNYKVTLGRYGYASQFEQNPVPLEGGMFKPHWFNNRVRSAPYRSKRIRYWDRAATANSGCATAGVLLALDEEGKFYIEHVVKGYWEPNERNAIIVATAQRDRARYGPKYDPLIVIEAERGSTGKESFQNLARKLAGFKIREDLPSGSKDVRAEPWADQLAALNVWIVEDQTWDIADYVQEHCLFRPDLTSKRLGGAKDQVDASCLVAGTKVRTIYGDRFIEDIEVGDMVLTRNGFRCVQWAGITRYVDDLVEVFFSNGHSIRGTYEHLVWTENREWVRLGDLDCSDRVVTVADREEIAPWEICMESASGEKSYSLEEFLTTGEKVITIGEREVKSHCIEQYGSTIMATSPMAIKYITRAATHEIITLKILSVSQLKNILIDTQEEVRLKDSGNILIRLGKKQQSGMDQPRDVNGIVSMASEPGMEERSENCYVLSAEVNSIVGELLQRCTVRRCVATVTDGSEEQINERKFVSIATSISWEGGVLVAVREFVGQECAGEHQKTPVYDLSVADDHEFFANGILVHNCGAFNMLAGARQSGTLKTYSFRSDKKKGLRVIVCNREEVATFVVENRTLLVSLQDPHPECNTLPPNAMDKLLDSTIINFSDYQPEELQDRWEDNIHPFNKKPAEIVMRPEDGKKFWAFVLKKRDPGAEIIVIQDDGDRRAFSLAFAFCDVMGFPRTCIFCPRYDDTIYVGMRPENQHVYDVVKATRGMVVG